MLSNPALIKAVIQSNPMLNQMAQQSPGIEAMFSNPEMMRSLLTPANLQTAQGFMQTMPPASLQVDPLINHAPGSVGQIITDMAPKFPDPTEDYKKNYATQLKSMKEMGFLNEEVNLEMLINTQGNVEAAIERLLSMLK